MSPRHHPWDFPREIFSLRPSRSHFTSTRLFSPFLRLSIMGYVVRACKVFAVSLRRIGRRYRPIRRFIRVLFAMFCRPTITRCGMLKAWRKVSSLIIVWMKSRTTPNSPLRPYFATGVAMTSPDMVYYLQWCNRQLRGQSLFIPGR